MMINRQQKKPPAGFTLVELLLYMGLFMGFVALLSALFVSILEVQTDSTSISHTDQDSWYIMNRLQYDLYRADSIVDPANDGEVSSSLVLDVAGSQITYSLVGNALSVTEGSATNQITSGEVTASNLSFKRLGNGDDLSSITVELQLQNAIISQVKDINMTLGLRK